MPGTLEQATKIAMDLPPDQRLALAGFLIESTEGSPDPDAEAAWSSEIRDRIRAIDEGREIGIPYEEVMRDAAKLLSP